MHDFAIRTSSQLRYAAASRLAGDVGDGLSVGTGSSLGECRRTCGSKRGNHGKVKSISNSHVIFALRNLGEMPIFQQQESI